MNILWIENDLDYLENCKSWIDKEGHIIHAVNTVLEAEDKLKKEIFDILFIDNMLPQNEVEAKAKIINFSGGVEVAEEWEKSGKSWKTPWGTPFAFITAILDDEEDDTKERAMTLINKIIKFLDFEKRSEDLEKHLYLEKPVGLQEFKKTFGILQKMREGKIK